MPKLRTVAAAWIASVVGIACTFAFLGLTGPFGPLVVDGLISGAVFAGGTAAGYVAAHRLVVQGKFGAV